MAQLKTEPPSQDGAPVSWVIFLLALNYRALSSTNTCEFLRLNIRSSAIRRGSGEWREITRSLPSRPRGHRKPHICGSNSQPPRDHHNT